MSSIQQHRVWSLVLALCAGCGGPHLAPPDRVAPSSQHYVAWYRSGSDAIWTRVAALAYEAETRQATLVGSVPEKEFELEITAEPAVNVASPSPNVVFAQGIGG